MPCRLIGDVHEGRNEVPTVPIWKPPNKSFWCTDQRSPVGSEDPVKLYCSLSLRRELSCIEYVGDVRIMDRQVHVSHRCNTTLLDLRSSPPQGGTPAGGQFGWGGTLLKRYQ